MSHYMAFSFLVYCILASIALGRRFILWLKDCTGNRIQCAYGNGWNEVIGYELTG